MEELKAQPVHTLAYASSGKPGPHVWAAVAVTLAGLGLIALGGCFLIGILIMMFPAVAFGPSSPTSVPAWTLRHYLFAGLLLVLAMGCMSAAAWLLVMGLRGLLRIMNSAA